MPSGVNSSHHLFAATDTFVFHLLSLWTTAQLCWKESDAFRRGAESGRSRGKKKNKSFESISPLPPVLHTPSGLKVGHFTGHKEFTCRTTAFLANMGNWTGRFHKQREKLVQLTLKRKRLLHASAVAAALTQTG